jgi:hypothetical protein
MQPDSCAPAPPAINHVDFMLVAAGGFLATLVMTTAMYVLPLIGWGQVDLPIWIVRVFTSDPVTVGEVGLGLHLFIGLAYAWVFGYQIEPRLALAPWQAGIIFGVGLWVFAQVIAVPALGALAGTLHPSTPVSPGWFAAGLGINSALSSLVAHIAYGTALSLVYGQRSAAPDGRPIRLWTHRPAAADLAQSTPAVCGLG